MKDKSKIACEWSGYIHCKQFRVVVKTKLIGQFTSYIILLMAKNKL